MVNVEYLDVSDNLLTDLTLEYMLCEGSETMRNLRVLNMSGNTLKVLTWNISEFIQLESKKFEGSCTSLSSLCSRRAEC